MPKQKKKHVHLPFEQYLKDDGAIIDCELAKHGRGYASTKDLDFQYDVNELKIGVKARFDAMSSGAAFVCRPIPANHEDYDALKAAVAKAVKEQLHDGAGTIDIWPFVRQMRSENRSNELRQATQRAAEELCAA